MKAVYKKGDLKFFMKNRTLYHYCDCADFYSIITNKNFRLSNIFESNDSMERRWLDSHIQKVFESLNGTEQMKTFQSSVHKCYELNRDIAPYAIAFSEEGDLLSQWRGYANDAHGFSIGMNVDYFNLKEEIPSPSHVPDATIGILKILYDEAQVYSRVEKIIKICWQKFQDDNYVDNSLAMIECSMNLVKLASFIKNPKFFEEKEWRILYTPIITQGAEALGKFANMKFKTTNNGLKSFFEMPFDQTRNVSPINEIIIGPKNRTTGETLKYFLDLHGLQDCRILRSALSYE